MRTYETCATLYASLRKYQHVGAKVGEDIWLKYDAEQDCYVASLVLTKLYETTADSGILRWKKATAKERDKYTMKVLARYFRDRIELTPPVGRRTTSGAFLVRHFRLLVRQIQSVKQQGFQWTRVAPDTPYYKHRHGVGEVVFAKDSISINREDKLVADAPPLERVFNKDNQKALNGRIREVRRMLGLRSKLGAFNGLDLEALERKCLADWGPRHMVEPKAITMMLLQVADDDHTSVLPLLWLSLRHRSHYWQPIAKVPSTQNWLELFNAFIDSNKESLRKHNNVVSYVENIPEEAQGQAA